MEAYAQRDVHLPSDTSLSQSHVLIYLPLTRAGSWQNLNTCAGNMLWRFCEDLAVLHGLTGYNMGPVMVPRTEEQCGRSTISSITFVGGLVAISLVGDVQCIEEVFRARISSGLHISSLFLCVLFSFSPTLFQTPLLP